VSWLKFDLAQSRILKIRSLLEAFAMPSGNDLSPLTRAQRFADRLGIRLPILLAPMAGACPPSLSIAVANAGGLGACGALMMKPDEILAWSTEFRSKSQGEFQLNLWIRDRSPVRDFELEKHQCEFLAAWGPPVPPQAGDAALPDFEAQCQAMLTVHPKAVSSIMGLYPAQFVAELKARGILWFATATTVAEAKAAAEAGADAIVAQGVEAGGHRGAFDADEAEQQSVGLMALLPQIVDAVSLPVIATGGIADARGAAAALILGASAVQIGTGLLRTPEAMTHPSYADRLGRTEAHETVITRAFSGRPGRSIATAFVRAALKGPPPAPYPVQRGLTSAMRESARKTGDAERMQMWAGQSAKLARAEPAGTIVQQLWADALRLLKQATVT
jgi:nitronate monooxygenase